MKIRIKDLEALNRIVQEERQHHGSTGWSDLQITVEQVEEDVQKGNLVSVLKVNLQYSVKKKNYNNREFKREYDTTIELYDCNEKQQMRCTKIVAKDSDDDAS